MNLFKRAYARCYQKILYVASCFLSFKEPTIINIDNGFGKGVKSTLLKLNVNNLFLVTGKNMYENGMLNPLINEIKEAGINLTIYPEVFANPTIAMVENGLKLYQENHCEALIAIGGGSALDCGKMITARSTNSRSVQNMKGLLKVKNKLPPFIAVPTTAGTGSETTIAAVIVNEETHDKYAISDPKLIPSHVIFEPRLLVDLPSHITSTTGMDALTHAVEAFIGKANTKKTKQYALSATKLIFDNLEKSYKDPTNLTYRSNMQLAAFQAGVAFTRAYVGNVHSIAHSIGGKYNVPHGLANAIILPMVLKEYGKKSYHKLAKLYDAVHHDDTLSKKEKANFFIRDIEMMLIDMNIANSFGHLIKDEDIDFLVDHSYHESYPLYPTPVIFDKETFKKIFTKLKY